MPMNSFYRMGDGAIPTGSNPTPDAYVYSAALHCPDCARKAFGTGPDGHIATNAEGNVMHDDDGNEIGVVMPWDWDRDDYSREHGEHCDTCGVEIIAPDNPATRAADAGLSIDVGPGGSISVYEDGALRLTIRDPRPDPWRHDGFVWTLTAYDGASPAAVVASDPSFAPAPSYRPLEDPSDAARVVAAALSLFAHCLTHNGCDQRIPSDVPGGDDWADWAETTASLIDAV